MSRKKFKFLMRTTFNTLFFSAFIFSSLPCGGKERGRIRDYGIEIGILSPGRWNSITDVDGVLVGHKTLICGDSIRTGVTAILPHDGNIFMEKVPGGVYVGNGFGKLVGTTQIEELGEIETPIVLTNTLSVSVAMKALVEYTIRQKGNEYVRSVNAVVGETNDGYLNEIRSISVKEEDVWDAIDSASTGVVEEGCVGAGTGTICLGFKGGIGTSSRVLPPDLGGWTVGVLVQTNFGGILRVNGAPVGRELGIHYLKGRITRKKSGSCMIIIATDAPLSPRNLKRLASRAVLGIARCGGFCSNGSGDYVIAFSTNPDCRIKYRSKQSVDLVPQLRNDSISPLFLAVVEATEEAILNSLFSATDMDGRSGHRVKAIPIDRVIEICKKYNVLDWNDKLPSLSENVN